MNNKIKDILQNKIITLKDAVFLRNAWKIKGEKLVFTNGVFDILHAGHVQSLAAAKDCGDKLIVGLNSDGSVKRLKGNNRPVIDQTNRAILLAALFFVDAVIIFDEDTPGNVISTLLPDVLVKSADYNIENIVGAKEVTANGGEVKIMPFLEGLSTTSIINKIKNG